jgi:DNA-binding CsgD family transcriptional regulator/tetratricopeptide (TPR) repeat protein
MNLLLERETPLREAMGAVLAARRGYGRTLLLCGEAGIGKSSLVERVVAEVGTGSGQRVLLGGCEDLFSPRPLGPLRDIAAALRNATLLQLIDSGASAGAVFSAFFELLDTQVVSSLVVFEDVHWADEATLDLVKYLARRIVRLPVLLLLTYRDDELGADHPLRQVLGDLPPAQLTRVTLLPLSQQAVAELACAAGRSADGLHAATGGNPFFVTEVLASGVADVQLGVPSSVRDAVHTRLARLESGQREVVDALCVVPGRVEMWLAAALLPAPRAAQDIDACIARGMLVAHDGALAFRHELARRATADALSPMQRQLRHARVLAALSLLPAGVPQPSLSRLAHHAAEAGDTARVLELAPRAAHEAATVGAHREAALQLATALRFADGAPGELRAQLHESWSYEAGLSLAIDARVIEARHQAIALWRLLGRIDKVGLNLRWLSRLHWYQGEAAEAGRYAEQAVAELEPLPPGPELAWAYSTRSQLYMLQDRTEPAIAWGERAIVLAQQCGEAEILCHALNNVGTAELFAGRPGGYAKLEQSLELARAGGFHEQAARVYTNAGEYAVVSKDYARAERWLSDGIEFDRQHDLDSWTHYLMGWLAQLRLEQGRLDEAERIAQEVLATPRLTAVMRLPALTVLARLHMRRDDTQADALIDEALAIAGPTGEAQRIVPLVATLVEQAWLRGDKTASLAALQRLQGVPGVGVNAWEAGEMAVWRQRTGELMSPAEVPAHAALPWQLELQGDLQAAVQSWHALGAPNEAALALLQAALQSDSHSAAGFLAKALQQFEAIGAHLGAARVRSVARERGLARLLPARKRGPYVKAREHPRGLSGREQQVLDCMAQGLSNARIAERLGLAQRTVEHHVSAVLAKFSAQHRHEAVALARREGLLTPPAP